MSYKQVTRIHAARLPEMGWDNVHFWIHQHTVRDGLASPISAGKLVFEPRSEGSVTPAAFALMQDEAQELMESLWSCGIRPKANASEGQLAEAHAHLNDLRAIAFHALKIPTK